MTGLTAPHGDVCDALSYGGRSRTEGPADLAISAGPPHPPRAVTVCPRGWQSGLGRISSRVPGENFLKDVSNTFLLAQTDGSWRLIKMCERQEGTPLAQRVPDTSSDC